MVVVLKESVFNFFSLKMDSDSVEVSLSEKINNAAQCAMNETLPSTSMERYLKSYDAFIEWKNKNGAGTTCETVMLAYFYEMSGDKKPSTLWAYYSMLKTVIKLKENLDIGDYHQLAAFLKRKSKGYVPVKAKTLEDFELRRFIAEADDGLWLDVKVVSIFGVCGALRGAELTKLTVADIEDHGRLYLVQVKKTKTKKDRSFTITGPFYGIVKKYFDLRPLRIETLRFFLNYQNGRCTNQVIGKEKLAGMARRIAEFLNLPDSYDYTGHSFRRTSASIYANTGASIDAVKNLGGWASTKVAEGYIQNSLAYKKRTGDTISSAITGVNVGEGSSSTSTAVAAFKKPKTTCTSTSGTGVAVEASPSFAESVSDLRVVSQAIAVYQKRAVETASSGAAVSVSLPCDDSFAESNSVFSVASQGYAKTPDDTIDDSMLIVLDPNEGEIIREPLIGPLQQELNKRNLSFAHCTVTINFKN